MNRLAIVTGGNRGIGFEVCRQLAQNEVDVILTSRDPAKGEAATARLREAGLPVLYHRLDVADPASIEELAHFIGSKYGWLHILVNNAGVFLDSLPGEEGSFRSAFQTSIDTLRQSLEINTFGPFLLCQQLIPFMRRAGYGRIVNVSSGMGQLSDMNGGWPSYRLSKTALNAVTRLFADETKGTNILVNSACPGWVRTEMGGPNATRSVEEGADTIVWLACLPDDGPTGGFYRDRKPIPW